MEPKQVIYIPGELPECPHCGAKVGDEEVYFGGKCLACGGEIRP